MTFSSDDFSTVRRQLNEEKPPRLESNGNETNETHEKVRENSWSLPTTDPIEFDRIRNRSSPLEFIPGEWWLITDRVPARVPTRIIAGNWNGFCTMTFSAPAVHRTIQELLCIRILLLLKYPRHKYLTDQLVPAVSSASVQDRTRLCFLW